MNGIREIFEQHQDKEWVFVAPGGNVGDHMIYLGAFKIATETGLNYRRVTYKPKSKIHQFDKDIIIYLQGGGGFNPWWNWTPWLLRSLRVIHPENYIIVGPTTTVIYREYLDRVLELDDNTTFFARELPTYNIMKEYCDDVRIDHDTALHLKLRDGYLEVITGDLCLQQEYSLLVLRKDPETPETIPESINRADFNMIYDPCKFKISKWAKLHMKATKIVANRSHSAIMGAILGKDTSMFAGSYHKNRSIWEYSLKDLGVKWIE